MKVINYNEKEIEEVRKIQQDCLKLHVIPPVLGKLKVEKINYDKEIIEQMNMKSNSYVRNAYNSIVNSLCFAGRVSTTDLPTTYDYGGVAYKTVTGGLQRNMVFDSSSILNFTIEIGDGATPDTLNDYMLQNNTTANFTNNAVSFTGSYNNSNKTIQVNISRTFINLSATARTVRETGIYAGSSYPGLMIRDVFTAVSLAQFEGITITYTLEMIFP